MTQEQKQEKKKPGLFKKIFKWIGLSILTLLILLALFYEAPNLNAIKSAAPAEAFIDPVTSNPLQYENHGERFSLYGETANIWPK